jgi:hypothetical protein
MSRKNRNIDEIFKERLSDYEAPAPSSPDWNELEEKLNQKASPVSFLKKWGPFLSSVIIIISGLTLFFLLYRNEIPGSSSDTADSGMVKPEGTGNPKDNIPSGSAGKAVLQDSVSKQDGATKPGAPQKDNSSGVSGAPVKDLTGFVPKSRARSANKDAAGKTASPKSKTAGTVSRKQSNAKHPEAGLTEIIKRGSTTRKEAIARAAGNKEAPGDGSDTGEENRSSAGEDAEKSRESFTGAQEPLPAKPQKDTLTLQDSLQILKAKEQATLSPRESTIKDSTAGYSFDVIRFYDNPAFTGLSGRHAVTLQFRNQWPQSKEGYITGTAGYEARLGNFGIGGYYRNTKEGFSTTDKGALSLAYHKRYMEFFRFSAAVSTYIRKISYTDSAAQPVDVNDPAFTEAGKTETGFNSALTAAWKGLFISASVWHQDEELSLYAGYKHQLTEKLAAQTILEMKKDPVLTSYTPSLYVTWSSLIVGGSYYRLNTPNVHVGWMGKRWYGLISGGYSTDPELRKYGKISSVELILNYRF